MPKHSLKVPHDILNGLIFPNVVSIKLMQRLTGQVRVVTFTELKATVSEKLYNAIYSDIELTGEYQTDDYHAIAYEQERF